MKLILVRHGEAIVSDSNRYLTLEGRSFFRKTARTMLKSGVEPSLIISSPLIRAVQTADILAESLGYKGLLIVRDELKPGFSMELLKALLAEYQGLDELVLVGHEPDLSSLAASFLSLKESFDFEKGTAICLRISGKDPLAPANFKWLASGKKVINSRKQAFAPIPPPKS